VASDSSGNGHYGTLKGNPIWLPTGGQIDGALRFREWGDYVDCGTFDPSQTTGQFTVSLWAKWDGQNGTFQGLAGKNNGYLEDGEMWVLLLYGSGQLVFGSPSARCITNWVLPIGKWTHIAATFDGNTVVLFVDAETWSFPNFSLGSATDALLLFGDCSKPRGPFNGALDDVRLYDRALSEDKVRELAGLESVLNPPR